MKKRIFIIISAFVIVFALACCISEKTLTIEFVTESQIPSGLIQTGIEPTEQYINDKDFVTNAEQREIDILCSKNIREAIFDKIAETHSTGVRIDGKAITFDALGNPVVFYYIDFMLCDCCNGQNTNDEISTEPIDAAKVYYKRKSIILSAIFGD